jgi:hypothetical protein
LTITFTWLLAGEAYEKPVCKLASDRFNFINRILNQAVQDGTSMSFQKMALVINVSRIGEGKPIRNEFSGEVVRIGSGENNDICLKSNYVGSDTGVLTRSQGQWELFVMGQTEVKVDEQTICPGERTLLPATCKIEIFPFELALFESANSTSAVDFITDSGQPLKSVELKDDQYIELELDSELSHLFANQPMIGDLYQLKGVTRLAVDYEGTMLVERQGDWEKPATQPDTEELLDFVERLLASELTPQKPFACKQLTGGDEVYFVRNAQSARSLSIAKPSFTAKEPIASNSILNFLVAALRLGKSIAVSSTQRAHACQFMADIGKHLAPSNGIWFSDEALPTDLNLAHIIDMSATKLSDKSLSSVFELHQKQSELNPNVTLIHQESLGQQLARLTLGILSGSRSIVFSESSDCVDGLLTRLEFLLAQQGYDFPMVQRAISSTVDLVCQISIKDGRPTVSQLTEIEHPVDGDYLKNSLFEFTNSKLISTGAVPTFAADLRQMKLIDMSMFAHD